MGRLATSKYIYSVFNLGDNSDRFPTKSEIVQLGLDTSGIYFDNHLVQEDALKIAYQTKTITFQLDWTELRYINPEGYQYLVNKNWEITPEIYGLGTATYNQSAFYIASYTYVNGIRTVLNISKAQPFTNNNGVLTFMAQVKLDPNNTTYFMFTSADGTSFTPDYEKVISIQFMYEGKINQEVPFIGTVVRYTCLAKSQSNWKDYCYIATSKNINNDKIVLNCKSRQSVTFYMYGDVGEGVAADLSNYINSQDTAWLWYSPSGDYSEYDSGWPITSYYRSNKTGITTQNVTKSVPIETSTVEYIGMDETYLDIDVTIQISLLGPTYLKFGNTSESCVNQPCIDVVIDDNAVASIYYNAKQNTSFEQPYQKYLYCVTPEEIYEDPFTIYLDIYDVIVF